VAPSELLAHRKRSPAIKEPVRCADGARIYDYQGRDSRRSLWLGIR
jgi:hypothetical protein